MATRRYAVYHHPDPPHRELPFECEAGSAVEAIARLERDFHARRRPREELRVRIHTALDGFPLVPEPSRSPVAMGTIEPAPFKVRFSPLEAWDDGAGAAWDARRDDAARIRFEVDGRATGELLEVAGRHGSQWIVHSQDSLYDSIGTGDPLTLREACPGMELASSHEREGWLRCLDCDAAAKRSARMER